MQTLCKLTNLDVPPLEGQRIRGWLTPGQIMQLGAGVSLMLEYIITDENRTPVIAINTPAGHTHVSIDTGFNSQTLGLKAIPRAAEYKNGELTRVFMEFAGNLYQEQIAHG